MGEHTGCVGPQGVSLHPAGSGGWAPYLPVVFSSESIALPHTEYKAKLSATVTCLGFCNGWKDVVSPLWQLKIHQ